MTQRPSTYTPELAARICARIARGQSVRAAARTATMTATATISLWLQQHEDFRVLYAAACEECADALVEEMLAIADDAARDQKAGGKDRQDRIPDREALARAKLRIETRRWRAAKLAPRKYGDKADAAAAGPAQISHEEALALLD